MAKKKRGDGHTGGHGWFVTFADLMGLMMSFFVMLVAFSNQDQQKLKIVAGSMREAFGVQTEARYSGVIESDGLPTRPKLKNVAHIQPEEASNTPTPDERQRNRSNGAKLKIDREFALASASLRQALQDMPELTEVSKHIMFEETSQGLNLEIVDREGLPPSHIFAVSGKADSQPLFPDDPTLPANRRVTITLMREDPPLPPGLKP